MEEKQVVNHERGEACLDQLLFPKFRQLLPKTTRHIMKPRGLHSVVAAFEKYENYGTLRQMRRIITIVTCFITPLSCCLLKKPYGFVVTMSLNPCPILVYTKNDIGVLELTAYVSINFLVDDTANFTNVLITRAQKYISKRKGKIDEKSIAK